MYEDAVPTIHAPEIVTGLRYTLVSHPAPLLASTQNSNGEYEQPGVSVARFTISIARSVQVNKKASQSETHVVKGVTFSIPQRGQYTSNDIVHAGNVLAQNTAKSAGRQMKAERSAAQNWDTARAGLLVSNPSEFQVYLDPQHHSRKAGVVCQPFEVFKNGDGFLELDPWSSLSFVISDIEVTTNTGSALVYITEKLLNLATKGEEFRTLHIPVSIASAHSAITAFAPSHSFIIANKDGHADVGLSWQYHGLTSGQKLCGQLSYYVANEETGVLDAEKKVDLQYADIVNGHYQLHNLNISTSITLRFVPEGQKIDEKSPRLTCAVHIQTPKTMVSELDASTITTKTLSFNERASGKLLSVDELYAKSTSIDSLKFANQAGAWLANGMLLGKPIVLRPSQGIGRAVGDGIFLATIGLKLPKRGVEFDVVPPGGMVVGFKRVFLNIGISEREGEQPTFYQPGVSTFKVISDREHTDIGTPFSSITLPVRNGNFIFYEIVGTDRDARNLDRFYEWKFEYIPLGLNGTFQYAR